MRFAFRPDDAIRFEAEPLPGQQKHLLPDCFLQPIDFRPIADRDRTDKAAGYEITSYEFQGKSLSFLVDEDMPADRIAVVTLDKCQKGWMEGDVLRYVEEPAASSREKRETLQGTFALIVDGVGYDHLDIYGIGA